MLQNRQCIGKLNTDWTYENRSCYFVHVFVRELDQQSSLFVLQKLFETFYNWLSYLQVSLFAFQQFLQTFFFYKSLCNFLVSLIFKSLFSLFSSFFRHCFSISASLIFKSACPFISCFCIFDSFHVISVLKKSTMSVFIGF